MIGFKMLFEMSCLSEQLGADVADLQFDAFPSAFHSFHDGVRTSTIALHCLGLKAENPPRFGGVPLGMADVDCLPEAASPACGVRCHLSMSDEGRRRVVLLGHVVFDQGGVVVIIGEHLFLVDCYYFIFSLLIIIIIVFTQEIN